MKRINIFLLAMVLAAPVVAVDFYRWVDERGGVHYSDQPPPPSIKKVKRMGASDGQATTAAAPQGAPVVLFSANCGTTCDQAADYLRQRGVPFTLKNVQQNPEYAAELRKRTGAQQVPVLFIGEAMQRGYSAQIWDTMLTTAGYASKPKPQDEPAEASPSQP